MAGAFTAEGRKLHAEENMSAGTLAMVNGFHSVNADEGLLSIADRLAEGARRVYALGDDGKIVWVISQARYTE